ncbi:hypothetical protein RZS08_67620, partial [Arthrospira platensis SPKY1]|nr:hypothetical protein [Arthrospira platensis SPKY1]
MVNEVIADTYRRLEGLLFTAGLRSAEIRHKIQEAAKSDRITAAVRMALDQERILEAKKTEKLNAMKEPEAEPVETIEEEL